MQGDPDAKRPESSRGVFLCGSEATHRGRQPAERSGRETRSATTPGASPTTERTTSHQTPRSPRNLRRSDRARGAHGPRLAGRCPASPCTCTPAAAAQPSGLRPRGCWRAPESLGSRAAGGASGESDTYRWTCTPVLTHTHTHTSLHTSTRTTTHSYTRVPTLMPLCSHPRTHTPLGF